MFNTGDKVRATEVANVRRTPGNVNKDQADVFAAVHPGDVHIVVSGPHHVDGLNWYELDMGGQTGFVIDEINGETVLIADQTGSSGIKLSRPVNQSIVVSQLWGENPEFYAQIQGYAAPLRGHNGVDYAAPEGTPVLACDDGIVERAGTDPWGFGELIVLRHAWGRSYYAHNRSFTVGVGSHVGRGQQVAFSGHTGLGMGAGGAGQDHLHFSIKIDGQDNGANGWGGFSDPTPYMEG